MSANAARRPRLKLRAKTKTPAANARPRAKQQVLFFHHANLIFTRTPKLPVTHFAFCLLGNDVCNGESRQEHKAQHYFLRRSCMVNSKSDKMVRNVPVRSTSCQRHS
jgi:hypothetical protein